MSHFEHVKVSDLERVGMSKPAARRLLDAVKRERKSAAGRRVRFPSFCRYRLCIAYLSNMSRLDQQPADVYHM